MRKQFVLRALGALLALAVVTTTVGAQSSGAYKPLDVPICLRFGATGYYANHEGDDYCASIGTPVHAVTGGKVVHIGNWPTWATVPWPDSVIIEGIDGRYLIYTHMDMGNVPVKLGQEVEGGQEIAFVGPKGNAKYWSTAHLHLGLFKPGYDPVKIQNQEQNVGLSWMVIWDDPLAYMGSPIVPPSEPDGDEGGGVEPPSDGENPPITSDDPDWLRDLKSSRDKSKGILKTVLSLVVDIANNDAVKTVVNEASDFIGKLSEIIGTDDEIVVTTPDTPVVGTPTESLISPRFSFSISAQQPGNEGYQHNIRVFFAWPTAGLDLSRLNEVDLENFEGEWVIQPGQTSVNQKYGSGSYEEGQGMLPPVGFKIGDGSCNAASFVKKVLSAAGLDVRCDDPDHAPVPGVGPEDDCTVCINTPAYPCETKDIWVTNNFDYPVTLHWRVRGDELTLWVTKSVSDVVQPPEPPTQPIFDWKKIGLYLVGLIAVLGLLTILFGVLFPRKTGEIIVWVANNGDYVKMMMGQIVKESLSWWMVTLWISVLMSRDLQHLIRIGFNLWIRDHWGEAVLLLALLINSILRAIAYSRRVADKGGYVVVQERSKWKGCSLSILGLMALAIMAVGLYNYAHPQSPEEPPPTQEDPTTPPSGDCQVSDKFPSKVLEYCGWITQYSLENNLDPDLTAALIWVESKGNPNALSNQGAVGLMQIMSRDTGIFMFRDRPSQAELYDPEFNISWGTNFLQGMINHYGSERDGLLHYGPTGMGYYYADLVLATRNQYK